MTREKAVVPLPSAALQLLPLRLRPGDDLRTTIETLARTHGIDAGFVLSGIGSASAVSVRLAGAKDTATLIGDFEILTLAGTVGKGGAHLHGSFGDATGQVFGGHIGLGCLVRTTAEILVAALPGCTFDRQFDPATGYRELTVLGSMQPR